MSRRNYPTEGAEAASGPPGDTVRAFIEHLRATGLSASPIRHFRPATQHFLT